MKIPFLNTLCITLVVLATSCKSEEKKQVENVESQIEYVGDNSMNSLDWDGTYEGELPCADCEGIKTVMTINKDNTYVLKETYLGKESIPYETKGTFKWDDQGQRITLSDTDRHPYFVGENTLTHLDEDGEKITGDLEALYILKKVQDQLTGKKWHLASVKGKDLQYKEAATEHAYLEFKDDFTIVGYTGCNELQGAYEVEGAQNIKFSKLLNTLKACPEMEIEGEFLKVVNATTSYKFEDHALVMYDKDHEKLATFKAAN